MTATAPELPALGWERHPADLARLIGALIGLSAVVALTLARPEVVTGLSQDLVALVAWLPPPLKDAALGVAQLSAVIGPVILLLVLIRRHQSRLIVITVLAASISAVIAVYLQSWLDDTAPVELVEGLRTESWLTGIAFPSPTYLAALAGVTTVIAPGFRPVWRKATWWILAAAAGLRLITAAAIPLHILAMILLGISIGSAVLLAVGAPGRRSKLGDARAAALTSGHAVTFVEPVTTGAVHLAELENGQRVSVRVVDRDERDADLLYRILSAAQRRGLGSDRPGWSPERVAQHEALVTMLAANGGVSVPEVVGVGIAEDRAAVLIVKDEIATSLADPEVNLHDELLAEVWTQVARLHEARIAHRALHLHNVAVRPGDARPAAVLITDLSRGEVAAGDQLRAADVAELLVSIAIRIGPERAAASARSLRPDALAAALPFLQSLALSSTTRRELRANGRSEARALLDALRTEVQGVAGVEAYELAPLQRITIGRIVGLLGTVVLFYVLLAFASNWTDIVEALGDADLRRLPLVVMFQCLTYVSGALSLMGSVPGSLPLWQTTEVMLAQSFLNRFTPANAGGMALRVRYLQRNGQDLAAGATSVGLTSAASGVAQVVLIIVFIVWSGRTNDGLTLSLPDVNFVVIIVVVVGVGAGVVWFTPLRAKLLDSKVYASGRQVLTEVKELATSPAKLALLFGGATMGKLVTILAFSQTCRAFGIDLPFAQIGALYLTATTVASAAPTPGGVGAIEAALVAVLTGAGVDPAIALSTVLVFRLITFWLPVPPAWLVLHRLRATDVV